MSQSGVERTRARCQNFKLAVAPQPVSVKSRMVPIISCGHLKAVVGSYIELNMAKYVFISQHTSVWRIMNLRIFEEVIY